MPFFMRFFGTGTPPNPEAIATAAHQIDSRITFDRVDKPEVEIWRVQPDGRRSIYGVLEVITPTHRSFESILMRYSSQVFKDRGGNPLVVETLTNCTFVASVELMFVGREMDETREGLAPIWDCLTASYTGLTQVDDEGFYRDADLILELH